MVGRGGVIAGLLGVLAVIVLGDVLLGTGGGESEPRPPRFEIAPAPRAVPGPAPAASYDDVIGRLRDRKVRVADGLVPIDTSVLSCTGLGTARRARGLPRWSRFTCTQSESRRRRGVDFSFEVLVGEGDGVVVRGGRYGGEPAR